MTGLQIFGLCLISFAFGCVFTMLVHKWAGGEAKRFANSLRRAIEQGEGNTG